MLNDFQKPAKVSTCGSAVIHGTRYYLDNDENRHVWLKCNVPTCECGEPLVEDNERRRFNDLAPVAFSTLTGDYAVICPECQREYPVQP